MLVGIDLFSGIGGMTLGFNMGEIAVPVSVEKDAIAAEYHHINLPDSKTICADIKKVSGRQLVNKPDVVFGGPPCQGFSSMGKMQNDDPRNLLIYEFLRLVRELRPKVFVMENVKGLINRNGRSHLEKLIGQFEEIGYEVRKPVKVLNAWHYGVPQKRERVFVLGTRKDIANSIGNLLDYPEPEIGKLTVRDALLDLPRSYSTEIDRLPPDYGRASEYGKKLQLPEGWKFLSGCRVSNHSQQVIMRFLEAIPGKKEPISRFYKLDWNKPCNTLLAGTGSERGGHTAPRPIHPSAGRCITVREAARLHSYPDWFQFYPTVWRGMRQIGNSVPPALAEAIAKEIVKFLR